MKDIMNAPTHAQIKADIHQKKKRALLNAITPSLAIFLSPQTFK